MAREPELKCITNINRDMPTASLPGPVVKMQAAAIDALTNALTHMFDNADDTLFEMADRAVSNTEQNVYFESMREVRIKRKGMETAFKQAIEHSFRRLPSSNPEVTKSGLENASFESLSLVQNNDLEESVAMERMVSKSRRDFAGPIYQIVTRLDTIMLHTSVNEKNNPLDPQQICKAFSEAIKICDVDIKAKLIVLKLFDRHVLQALEKVYNAANQVLVDHGILPGLKATFVTPKSNARKNSAGTIGSGNNAGTNAGVEMVDAENAASASLFSQLQELLSMRTAGLPRLGLMNTNAIPVAAKELMGMLSGLQHNYNSEAVVEDLRSYFDIRSLLENTLMNFSKNDGKPRSFGQPDEDVINLVSMLFEFILDDPNLSNALKALIGRLQIPILKVAIIDKSFFTRAGHPARKLLNELARAGIGLHGSKGESRDNMFRKIHSIVQQVLTDFQDDVGLFEELLADFVAFTNQENRRADLIEQRMRDAEEGKARSENARSLVDQCVMVQLENQVLPSVVVKLLQGPWSNVLFLVLLKFGQESVQWKHAESVMETLIWSVQLHNDADSRKKLMYAIPNLLRHLREGLTSVSYNPFEMSQLFQALENIHMKLLKGETPDHLVAKERDPADDLVEAVSKDLGDFDNKAATNNATKIASFPSLQKAKEALDSANDISEALAAAQPTVEISEDHIKLIERLGVGAWLEFTAEDGSKFRGKLAAKVAATGKFIFVNRSGVKVLENTVQALARDLVLEKLSILDDALLFDRALQSVIGNLRSTKAQQNNRSLQ